MKRVLLIFFVLKIISFLFCDIIHVPTEQPTIQEGINAASNGDTVLVADGVYTGNLNRYLQWYGNIKHLVIKSENGPINCIMDLEDNGCAFYFIETGQDSTDVIEGFTIKNCDLSSIVCEHTSPTVIGNIIKNNHSGCGGGIYLLYSDAIITQNIITQNLVTPIIYPGFANGGGIYIASGSPKIMNNIITDNTAYTDYVETSATAGGIYVFNSNALICNNLISDNYAYSITNCTTGGIEAFIYSDSDISPQIINNTIHDNLGSGIYCIHGAIIKNNIITDNSTYGLGLHFSGFTGDIYNNNVWNNYVDFTNCPPGIGDATWGVNINGTACDSCLNISENPLFCTGSEGDFFLSQLDAGQNEQSPCVDAGEGFPVDYGLEEFSTRIDLEWDTGFTDMGFHYKGLEIVQNEYTVVPYSQSFLTNYPNPFNPSTTISFDFSSEQNKQLELVIYNLKGQKVRDLSPSLCHPESFDKLRTGSVEGGGGNKINVVWNGTDDSGKLVSSGIYFAKMKAGNQIATRKMLLMK